ncbi:MAG: phosphate ABC transporter substrate-binding protein [Methanosarcinales archaeon]|nr:phosphate ABC transporter substrate-binding protein [Methanosarcinales archaeon]
MEKPHTIINISSPSIVMKILLIIAVVAISLAGSGCTDNEDTDTSQDTDTSKSSMKLQIAGSTTVLPIAEECARIFMENNPGSQVYVSGGGSSHGVKSVAEGVIDIGDASRDLKNSEKEQYTDLVTHAVAKDGVAIIVHPSNTINDLTITQLQGIYTGEITNWKDVGGEDIEIMVVSREGGSGTRDCFEQVVLKPIEKDVTEYAIIQDSNGKVRTTITGSEQGIGFISLGYVNSDVKAVNLDGTEPTIENIQSNNYAISRTLWMITKGNPDENEQAFLDFVLSDEGQNIVSEVHYISL